MGDQACPACGMIFCIWAKSQIAGHMAANEFTGIVAECDSALSFAIVVNNYLRDEDWCDGTFWSEEEYEAWELTWPE